MILFKQSFVLATLCIISLSFNLTFDQFINSTPKTFGLHTVTHDRNGDYSYFRKHLNYYAQMECSTLTEIIIVWNNDVDPQKVGFIKKQSWKRPVYFFRTPSNSMDFRYNIPKESKASVFFSVDDDITTSCQQLLKSFEIWKQNAIGDIGPLVTFEPRSFDFSSRREEFTYIDQLKAKYFTFGLIGISWISRFYFQIYTSTKSWEINKIRQIVRRKNNCDDIALNYLINFFFPQFVTVHHQASFKMGLLPSSQGLTSTHYMFRNECIKQFTDIFGFNPLRIVSKMGQNNVLKYKSQTTKFSIYLKRKEIYEKLIMNQSLSNQIAQWQSSAAKGIGEMQKILEEKVLVQKILTEKGNVQKQGKEEKLVEVEKQLSELKQKYEKQLEQNKKQSYVPNKNLQQIKNDLSFFKSLSILISIVVIIIFIFFCLGCFQSQNQTSKVSKGIKLKFSEDVGCVSDDEEHPHFVALKTSSL